MIYQEVVIKVGLAVVLGAILGFERQKSGKITGIRTHILLTLASCMLIIISLELFLSEVTRVVQGLVTGMGFIGAGVILHKETRVLGITTAATLWITTIIGIIIGFGFYFFAFLTTILTFLILLIDTKPKRKKK